jgi:hypothetical protein
MKRKTIISGLHSAAAILVLALAAVPSQAQTPPEVTLTTTVGSTTYTVTIDSTGTPYYSGACTAALCPGTPVVSSGKIIWEGATLGNFIINQIVAQTSPSETIPDDVDVAANLSTGAAGGTITISYSALGFSIGDSPATINVVQGQAGTYTTTSYTGYVDTTNKLFGTGTQVGTTSAGGILSGLPGPKTNPFSMTVSETLTLPASVGANGSASFNNDLSLMVADYAPLSLQCGASTGKVGSPYNSSLLANGGVAPYTFSIIGGSISPLSLNSATGALSGTPTAGGTLSFTAQVVDSSGTSGANTATAACTITIPAVKVPQLTATCPASTATVGQWYSSPVGVSGGVPPYKYSLYFGSLPSGLSLNTSTGVISGTPTQASQTGAFKIEVTDSAGNVAYTNCSGSCSSGITITYGGVPSDYTGTKSVSVIYSSNGLSLPVYGYSTSNQPIPLYVVSFNPNAFLGISDSNWDQLDSSNYVQFDIGTHIANGATGLSFVIASQSNTTTFDIYGSNTQGSMGTKLVNEAKISSWNGMYYTGSASVPNFNSYRYISIYIPCGAALIQSLSVNYQCSCAIDVSGGQKCPRQCGW